ncbi:MAG: DUF262 domain-containing protein [Hahellaceae bacterium]|nr:DUF262 domain-containing protein [Hahellaceae bacterium]
MNDAVRSELLTLKNIADGKMGFVIPSYQRPYVWHDDDVRKLLVDIKQAYMAEEGHYFIGTVLSSLHSNEIYELIDGQQRITTLMLISLAFKSLEIECDLSKVSIRDNTPRIKFEIRDTVLQLLGSLAGLDTFTKPSDEEIKQNPYLTHIAAAHTVSTQFITTHEAERGRSDLKMFADFIYEKVQWVNNVVPSKLDLNRLFYSLNTAGVQLEPVDMLKAKLLKKIESEKPLYNAIWQACEHTENYFEQNLRHLFRSADWKKLEYKGLGKYDEEIFAISNESVRSEFSKRSIEDLFRKPVEGIIKDDVKKEVANSDVANFSETNIDDATVYCRSIISFDLLLIHTLRIFLLNPENSEDVRPRIKAGNLLSIFEILLVKGEEEIKKFIKLLWEVRYQFDTWVVKWVEHDDSNDPQLRLTSQTKSSQSDNINRTLRELSSLVQLQAVRYYTGDRSAHYWLTPFLAMLIEKPDMMETEVLEALEKVDNVLSLTTETQKEASFALANNKIPQNEKWEAKLTYFSEAKGTAFAHYWFQKLEYLLWKGDKNRDDKPEKYRITSKNSVEHVYPQNEEYGRTLDPEKLHAFGNLVLLSPGENSSYGKQSVVKKKADFESKPRYDSLKLREIFRLYDELKKPNLSLEQVWPTVIERHQETMMKTLKDHYDKAENRRNGSADY